MSFRRFWKTPKVGERRLLRAAVDLSRRWCHWLNTTSAIVNSHC